MASLWPCRCWTRCCCSALGLCCLWPEGWQQHELRHSCPSSTWAAVFCPATVMTALLWRCFPMEAVTPLLSSQLLRMRRSSEVYSCILCASCHLVGTSGLLGVSPGAFSITNTGPRACAHSRGAHQLLWCAPKHFCAGNIRSCTLLGTAACSAVLLGSCRASR